MVGFLGGVGVGVVIEGYDKFSEPADRVERKVQHMAKEIQKASGGTLEYSKAQEIASEKLSFFEGMSYKTGISTKALKFGVMGLAGAATALVGTLVSLATSTRENQIAISQFKTELASAVQDGIEPFSNAINKVTTSATDSISMINTYNEVTGKSISTLNIVNPLFYLQAQYLAMTNKEYYEASEAALALNISMRTLASAIQAEDSALSIMQSKLSLAKMDLKEVTDKLNEMISGPMQGEVMLNNQVAETKLRILNADKEMATLREQATYLTGQELRDNLIRQTDAENVKRLNEEQLVPLQQQKEIYNGQREVLTTSSDLVKLQANKIVEMSGTMEQMKTKVGEQTSNWIKTDNEVVKLNKFINEELKNKTMYELILKTEEFFKKFKDGGQLIDEVKKKIEGITFDVRISKGGAGAGFVKTSSDFISRPGMPAQPFSPDDTIIGVKKPGQLGGNGIIVNIQNMYASDPQNFAIELQRELNRYITT